MRAGAYDLTDPVKGVMTGLFDEDWQFHSEHYGERFFGQRIRLVVKFKTQTVFTRSRWVWLSPLWNRRRRDDRTAIALWEMIGTVIDSAMMARSFASIPLQIVTTNP